MRMERQAPESEEAAEGSVLAVSAGCGGSVCWEVLNTAAAGAAQGLQAGMDRVGVQFQPGWVQGVGTTPQHNSCL